jgi:hypothetical protein
MRDGFKDREHLFRMAALFVAGLAAFVVLRGVLVPADFAELGHYRTSAIADNRALTPRFAGRALCEACHDDVVETRAESAHARIACEACHGALAAHADDPGEVVPELPAATPLCISCHEAASARPSRFPQVDSVEHAAGAACDDCHLPHRPEV